MSAKRRFARLFAVGGAVLLAVVARAQPALAADDPWRFAVTPYLWLPEVDAEMGIDAVPFTVDSEVGASDIFDKLDFAAMVLGDMRKGRWGIQYDLQYLSLSDDGNTGPLGVRTFDSELTYMSATLGVLYRVLESPQAAASAQHFLLDTFAGARLTYFENTIDIDPGAVLPAISGSQDTTFVDPMIGLKCHYRINQSWSLDGYGDIGGFGAGSELTYQLLGAVGYHFTDHLALHAGWRYFFIDYEDGGFELDATMHGPIVGISFSF